MGAKLMRPEDKGQLPQLNSKTLKNRKTYVQVLIFILFTENYIIYLCCRYVQTWAYRLFSDSLEYAMETPH